MVSGRADLERDGPTRRLCVAAAVGLVVAFVLARAALLVTSYDANQNWEEPVFLFSATELQRDGLSHVFDHQDDLNHGGSIVLLLLAVPWLSVAGTSLVALKGVAILWSALTLLVCMAVAWRYFSPRVALLLGVSFLALSPTASRLNVTLVGSHPEALLPCTVAMATYLEWTRRRGTHTEQHAWLAAALGLASALAIWVAYVAAMFVMPLLMLRLAYLRRGRTLAALVAGLLLGAAPWGYQNLWLRPHGATAWRQHLGGAGSAEGWPHALGELAESFGYGTRAGAAILAVGGLALLALGATVLLPAWRMRSAAAPLAIVPVVLAPFLGLALLAHAVIPFYPHEGYYHYRFFIPLQAALFWGLALAVDLAARAAGRSVAVAAVVAALTLGVWGQAPLYAQGTHYQANFARDRAAGCMVFGVAEWDRSPSPQASLARLASLADDLCRERAFAGFGWRVAGRYLQDGNLDGAQQTLAAIPAPALRWAACGGFAFVLTRAAADRITPERRAEALRRVVDFCRADA